MYPLSGSYHRVSSLVGVWKIIAMLLFGSKTPSHDEDTQAYIPLSEADEKSSEELELSIQLLRQELRSVKKQRRLLGASICLFALALGVLSFLLFANSTKNLRYVTEIPGKEMLLTPVPPRLFSLLPDTVILRYFELTFIVPLTTVTFEQDEQYSTRPSPESDRAWNALLPVCGYIEFENSDPTNSF